MNLHFDRTKVEQLLAHATAAEEHRLLYEDKATDQPGLWLVGDQGVYLMSNGRPPLLLPDQPDGGEKNLVVYATEVDPTRLKFEAWWQAKNMSFGGDDGIEFFTAKELIAALVTYKPGEPLTLSVSPAKMGVISFKPATSPRRPARAQA